MASTSARVDVEFSMRSIPPRQVLADEVYVRLKSLIMASSIAPGTRINIEDIARQLEISPTPVRESLARLESDGLVDKLPLKGYRTTELLDRDQVRELYELRLLLEPNAAQQAALRITQHGIDELRAELASCQISGDDAEVMSYQDLSNHDVRIHDLILALAGNETIRQAYARTHCHLHTFRLAYAGTFGHHTLEEHAAIVEAVAAGDPDAAHEAMRLHVESSQERVLSQFDIGPAATVSEAV
ncbi:MAG TPA: GntR family transcriptional regulator [Microbacteriaceae bacterium]